MRLCVMRSNPVEMLNSSIAAQDCILLNSQNCITHAQWHGHVLYIGHTCMHTYIHAYVHVC